MPAGPAASGSTAGGAATCRATVDMDPALKHMSDLLDAIPQELLASAAAHCGERSLCTWLPTHLICRLVHSIHQEPLASAAAHCGACRLNVRILEQLVPPSLIKVTCQHVFARRKLGRALHVDT